MAEKSLSDIVERLKAEGQLTRNSGTNSFKTVKDSLKEQNSEFKDGLGNLVAAFTGNKLADKEAQIEQSRYNDRVLAALEGMGGRGGDVNDNSQTGGVSLGNLGLGLAATIGTTIGVLAGQFKAVKAFASAFNPEIIKGWFAGIKTTIYASVDAFKLLVSESIAGLKTSVAGGFTKLANFFTFADDSKIGGVLKNIGTRIGNFTEIFKSLGGLISSLITGPITVAKNSFSLVTSYMSSFGAQIGKIAGFVGKVFAPIAVVMAAYDTIMGALEGFEKDGILGGIKGAIDGLIGSLITKPLDLLKDAVAWVLEKLGFDSASTFLTSFSFTEIFTNITTKIFDGVKGIFTFFGDLITSTVSGAADLAGSISTMIGDTVASVKQVVVDLFNNVVDSITSFDLMGALGNLSNMGENFLKGILGAVLPPADALVFDAPSVTLFGKKFGGGQINLNPIPDSMYEWINAPVPKIEPAVLASAGGGGADKLPPVAEAIPEIQQMASTDLASAQTENTELKDQANTTTVIAPSSVVNNNSSNIINNGQPVLMNNIDVGPAPAQKKFGTSRGTMGR